MRKIILPALFLILIILMIYGGIFCSRKNIKGRTNLSVSGSEDCIIIDGEKYQLIITKADGFATLKNRAGECYTSFPLSTQFNNPTDRLSSFLIDWQVKNKEIIMHIKRDGFSYQKVVIKPFSEAIEINFGVKFLPENSGTFLCKRGDTAFDTNCIDNVFSPEPDNFYSSTPQIDVRVDRDQQWAFAPSPLNLSFQTDGGWFSIGLAKLPHASIFAYKEQAIFIDHCWNKIAPTAEEFYWLEPVVFTFNESPWDALADFRSYLLKHKYISINKEKNKKRPGWWSNPLVSTKGEQLIQEITHDKDGYNSNWVENYVLNQEQALDDSTFTIIIDDKWCYAYGDPNPCPRFKNMRELIDWCHERGHKVLLSWRAWKIEARSYALRLNIGDGEYIDATHPKFEAYIDTCCQILFGSKENQLNADGLKLDNLFLVRDPSQANYSDSAIGMGMKELHHYMKLLYKYAKKYKHDCLISGTAIDSHFGDVQDMVRINSAWDNKLRREKRARIITQTLPNLLIDGDASDMYEKIALYHYATSAVYGVPSIQYLTRFHDGEITEKTRNIINDILKLSITKPAGKLEFINYGNWRIVDNNKILAESLPQGKGIVVYDKDNSGTLLCTQNTSVHLVLNKRLLKSVVDEDGNKINFNHRGQGIYELIGAKQGNLYKLSLRKIISIYDSN